MSGDLSSEFGNGGREALAQVLSDELDRDLDPAFMKRVDLILLKLADHGYIVAPIPVEEP